MKSADPRLGELQQLLADRYPELTPLQLDRFNRYYALVLKWNGLLHLTTLVEPKDFMERHIVEVLIIHSLIDRRVNTLWDLGSGVGVPGIPLAILRPDLNVRLVESSRKRAIFLETVIDELNLDRCEVDCRRIETLPPPTLETLLTARAVEKMASLIPLIQELATTAGQAMIFISLETASLLHQARLHPLPGADRRCVAILECST